MTRVSFSLSTRRARLAATVLTAAALLLAPSRSDADEPQAWVLWADISHGFPAGQYPSLAIAPNGDFFATIQAPQGDAHGRVWRTNVSDPARQFEPMPSFPLPPPAAGSQQANVSAMTVNLAGEPVVALYAAGQNNNTAPLLFRWDSATSAWVAATLTPNLPCGRGIQRLERGPGPDGVIWAGCQWHDVYRSTDGGRTFAVLDESAILATTDPGYFPTRAAGTSNAGAVYGLSVAADGTVYLGTETAGGIYSSDQGKTFHPVDVDYQDPMSAMARITNAGNCSGVGVAADGKVIYSCRAGLGAFPVDDGVRLWVADRAARTVTSAVGMPAGVIGNQAVTRIVTNASGVMFLHTNAPTIDLTNGTPAAGGVYRSLDGVHWEQFNAGIKLTSHLAQQNVWVDGNGHGVAGAFAVSGDDVYLASTQGSIWLYGKNATPAGGTGGSGGASGTGGGAASSGGTSGGCSCQTGSEGSSPGAAALATLLLGVLARRRRAG
jgi:MYXO-CTERM domain-containing protein